MLHLSKLFDLNYHLSHLIIYYYAISYLAFFLFLFISSIHLFISYRSSLSICSSYLCYIHFPFSYNSRFPSLLSISSFLDLFSWYFCLYPANLTFPPIFHFPHRYLSFSPPPTCNPSLILSLSLSLSSLFCFLSQFLPRISFHSFHSSHILTLSTSHYTNCTQSSLTPPTFFSSYTHPHTSQPHSLPPPPIL